MSTVLPPAPRYVLDHDGEVLRWIGPTALSKLDVFEIEQERDGLGLALAAEITADAPDAAMVDALKRLYVAARERIAAMERMIDRLGQRRAWAGHLVVADELHHDAQAGA